MGTPLSIKELTETGNRASKRLATVKQLEASDLICVCTAKYSSQVLDVQEKLSRIILKSKCVVSERKMFLEKEKKYLVHLLNQLKPATH